MARMRKYIWRLNQWRIQRLSNRNFLVILSILVGVMGGLAAAALKGLTHSIASFLQAEVQWEYKYYLYLFFPLVGILLSVVYVRGFIKRKHRHKDRRSVE